MKIIQLSLVAIILCCACSPAPTSKKGTPTTVEASDQVAALSKRLDAAEAKISSQATQISILNSLIGYVDNSPAYLDTSVHNFDIAKTQYGAFTIAVDKVEPYLDGYNATLRIGNPSDAEFTGGKLTVTWGLFGRGQKKEFDIEKNVLPGRFTLVTVALTPAKPEDVKNITVMPSFEGIKLGIPLPGEE